MASPQTEKEQRTLGDLGADDLGKVLTVRRGPAVWTGVLADVRHHRGATSFRQVTTYTLLWRDSHESILRLSNHHGEASGCANMPDASTTPCEVAPEQVNPPGSTSTKEARRG